MKYLEVKNFKCFRDVRLPINGLTVLAGANGNGKSSSIQALLLLRSTIERCSKLNIQKHEYEKTEEKGLTFIELNGKYCLNLGNCEHVISHSSNNSIVELEFSDMTSSFEVKYDASGDSLYLRPFVVSNRKRPLILFQHEFHYLNAERLGPRIKQEIRYFDFPNTGFQGEYVAQLLGDTDFSYSFKVEDLRRHPKVLSPRLEQQVNAWLNELMPGVSVSSKYDRSTMSAQITMDNFFSSGGTVLPPNIGFGISYVLPIIVTGLIAQKGSMIIVENPEAHLHPSAQSKIGRFLSMVAESGVSVIVETHSDHVLNGIQIACAKCEIKPSSVSVNYFTHNENSDQPILETISVNEKGELSYWPRGFFDQTQIDFAELFRLRKR